MRTTLSFAAAAVAVSLIAAMAQTPPTVVPAAAAPAPPPTAQATGPGSTVAQTALPLLQAMRAANEATLKKQEATLQQLDEIQKAAEQIKIYTKRS